MQSQLAKLLLFSILLFASARINAQYAIYTIDFAPSTALKPKLDSAIYHGLSKGHYLSYSNCYLPEDYHNPLEKNEDWESLNRRLLGKEITNRSLILRSNLELVRLSLTYEDVFTVLLPERKESQNGAIDPEQGLTWQEIEARLGEKFRTFPRTYQVTLFLDSTGKIGFQYLNLVHPKPAGSFGFVSCDIFDDLGELVSTQLMAEIRATLIQKISTDPSFANNLEWSVRSIEIAPETTNSVDGMAFENQFAELLRQCLYSIKEKEIDVFANATDRENALSSRKLLKALGLKKIDHLAPSNFEILLLERIGPFGKRIPDAASLQSCHFFIFSQKQYKALGFRHQNGKTFWLDFEKVLEIARPIQFEKSLNGMLDQELWKQLKK